MHQRWKLRCDHAQDAQENENTISAVHAKNEATRLHHLKIRLPPDKHFVFKPSLTILLTKPTKIIQQWIRKNKPFITDTILEIKLKAEIRRLYDLRDHIPDELQHVYSMALEDLLKAPIEILKSWIKKNKTLITTVSDVTLLYDLKHHIHINHHHFFEQPLHILLQKSIPTIKHWLKRNRTIILKLYDEHQQLHPHNTTPFPHNNHSPQPHNHTNPTNLTINSPIS